jgi:hypothetical protein
MMMISGQQQQVRPAAGQVRDANDNIAGVFFCIFGIGWLALVWARAVAQGQTASIALAMILAAPGVAVIALGLYWLLCLARYGRSVFESPSLPASTGGLLTGTIRPGKPLRYRKPIQATLSCVAIRYTSGRQYGDILWEDHRAIDGFATGDRVSNMRISFEIPRDAQPTAKSVYWRLHVKADGGLIGYRAWFKIPVVAGTAAQA